MLRSCFCRLLRQDSWLWSLVEPILQCLKEMSEMWMQSHQRGPGMHYWGRKNVYLTLVWQMGFSAPLLDSSGSWTWQWAGWHRVGDTIKGTTDSQVDRGVDVLTANAPCEFLKVNTWASVSALPETKCQMAYLIYKPCYSEVKTF